MQFGSVMKNHKCFLFVLEFQWFVFNSSTSSILDGGYCEQKYEEDVQKNCLAGVENTAQSTRFGKVEKLGGFSAGSTQHDEADGSENGKQGS